MPCQLEVPFGSQCSMFGPSTEGMCISPLVSPHLLVFVLHCARHNLYVMSACSVRRSFSRLPWLSFAIYVGLYMCMFASVYATTVAPKSTIGTWIFPSNFLCASCHSSCQFPCPLPSPDSRFHATAPLLAKSPLLLVIPIPIPNPIPLAVHMMWAHCRRYYEFIAISISGFNISCYTWVV